MAYLSFLRGGSEIARHRRGPKFGPSSTHGGDFRAAMKQLVRERHRFVDTLWNPPPSSVRCVGGLGISVSLRDYRYHKKTT